MSTFTVRETWSMFQDYEIAADSESAALAIPNARLLGRDHETTIEDRDDAYETTSDPRVVVVGVDVPGGIAVYRHRSGTCSSTCNLCAAEIARDEAPGGQYYEGTCYHDDCIATRLSEKDAKAIDYERVFHDRRLIATFQPQQWIRDEAMDSDPAVMVDVTDAYLALDPQERAEVRDNRDSSDELVHRSVDVWKRHGGPGYVTIEDAIAAFHGDDEEDA